ncbi:hypothetical protein chiPu_0014194 [Chiloscyllium punctatum]|uniref:Sodium-coupled monocarboxylate transporter 1 n=1 Tax=Chiloscyllium punctatum TaxID=137246 RepID=A0A401SZA0_CHIPU|nr:hypothetical protein [Chiloscyllium punctatum]
MVAGLIFLTLILTQGKDTHFGLRVLELYLDGYRYMAVTKCKYKDTWLVRARKKQKIMYAVYENCDPIKANRVNSTDELTPLLVMELFHQMPGFPGLFVAGAYSGTLSTISSGISSMAAVCVEDFIKPIWKPWGELSNRKKILTSKLLAMTFGLVTIGLTGVSSLMGRNIIQATLTFEGMILGPILGVFTLAALFPKSNGKGACVGWFVGVALSTWIGIGGLIYPPSNEFKELLETSTAGCMEINTTTSTPVNVTSPLTTIIFTKQEERPIIAETIYSISFFYYSPIAWLSTLIVGLVVSMLTGGNENLDPCLIAPIVHTVYKYIFKTKPIPSIAETNDNLIHHPMPKESSKDYFTSAEEANMSVKNSLQAWDYVVFAAMLVMSTAIGIYFAITSRRIKGKSTEEFLIGNRQISAYPIALSLAASFLSAITVVGGPAEVYLYGIMVLLYNVAAFFTTIVTCLIYIPLFYRLNIISTYEFIYLGIATYTPALALSEVTGINLWISIITTGCVCTLYTTLGGIKAVVWTDVLQICVMVAGLLALLIQGLIQVGGIAKVWRTAENGGRLNFFDFDPDPRKRHTFWTTVVGGTFVWVAIYGSNQAQIQRYLACKSEKEAKNTISSGINAMTAVFVEDIIKPNWRSWNYLSDDKRTVISKFLAMTFGGLTMLLAGLTSILGENVMQLIRSIDGVFLGPLLGVFTLAALFPNSNSKGAFVGMLFSSVMNFVLGIGSQVNSLFEDIFSISYGYYTPVGCLTAVIIGLLVSMVTGGAKDVDKALIAPIIHTVHNFFSKQEPAVPVPESGIRLLETNPENSFNTDHQPSNLQSETFLTPSSGN